MQLTKQQNKVVNRGIEQKYYYSVANTPKIMEMLGNFLYSDKIMAPIRELTTNAIDSHVVAGTTDKPIKFKLPTNVEETPTFSIRDYGEGMSEEKLVKLYRVYGLSTKDDDDEQQGAYGLGSKSPFAYTDSFTTTSYYNGKKYVYINSKSCNGVPTLNKMGEFDTDEPNGIEISFPIRLADITEFQQKLQIVLKRCPIPYECNKKLYVDDNHNSGEVLIEGNDWKLFNDIDRSAKAIMGYIEYPINLQYFNEYRNLLQQNIEMFFDIGEIEMDISREKLQYNEKTINAIRNKCKDIENKAKSLIESKIKDTTCMYDARYLLFELAKRFKSIITNNISWNNQIILYDARIRENLIDLDNDKEIVYITMSYGRTKFSFLERAYNFHLNTDTAIIINDLPSGKGGLGRARQFIKSSKYKYCLLVPEKLKIRVIKEIGLPEDRLIFTSKLRKIDRAIGSSRTTQSYPAKVYNGCTNKFISTKISKKLGKQKYLICCRDRVEIDGSNHYIDDVKKLLKAIYDLDLFKDEIYLVIPSKVDIVKNWGWQNLQDYISDKIKSKLKINKRKLCLSFIDPDFSILDLGKYNVYNSINKGDFKKYIKFLKLVEKIRKDTKIKNYLTIKNFFKTTDEPTIKVGDLKINIEEINTRILNKYPLIPCITNYYYHSYKESSVLENLIHYINLVDSK